MSAEMLDSIIAEAPAEAGLGTRSAVFWGTCSQPTINHERPYACVDVATPYAIQFSRFALIAGSGIAARPAGNELGNYNCARLAGGTKPLPKEEQIIVSGSEHIASAVSELL